MVFLVFVFEVTDMVATQIQLRNAQDMLELAITASEIGIWRADLITDELITSPRTSEMFGIPESIEMTLALSLQMIANEDRDRVVSNIAHAIETRTIFSDEYWINPLDGGKPKWLRSNGKAFYNEKGYPLYITGAIFDLTEQKENENRKNDFIGMVSHELKTPLTSLNAILQVTSAKLKSSEDSFLAGAMQKASVQLKRMSAIINGFLNVSRLESANIIIEKANFQLEELVADVIEETSMTISSHHFQFEPCPAVAVIADRDKISSVISNLIENAVKYSPNGTNINVKFVIENSDVIVSVADEGMGIAQEDIIKIFDRYYCVQSNHSKHISGFGIGLYLSAVIISGHNGKIWAESEIGKGSTFYFSLPL